MFVTYMYCGASDEGDLPGFVRALDFIENATRGRQHRATLAPPIRPPRSRASGRFVLPTLGGKKSAEQCPLFVIPINRTDASLFRDSIHRPFLHLDVALSPRDTLYICNATISEQSVMATAGFILLVFAFVLAVIASFVGPVTWALGRVHFGWLAFAFYVASLIFGGR